jgi:hypothetical protein
MFLRASTYDCQQLQISRQTELFSDHFDQFYGPRAVLLQDGLYRTFLSQSMQRCQSWHVHPFRERFPKEDLSLVVQEQLPAWDTRSPAL